MSEKLIITTGSKDERYQTLMPQLKALVEGESDMIANMANLTAALQQAFSFFWTGFYLVKDEMLVLGPFQGPIACTRIKYGKGVCGTAWKDAHTVIVPNVDEFPGHIVCSSSSKSEIVVPVYYNGLITGVLDIDSAELNTFDETDARYLEQIVSFLCPDLG